MLGSLDEFQKMIGATRLNEKAKQHARKVFKPPIARELALAIDALEEIKAICPPEALRDLCLAILGTEYAGDHPREQPRLAEQLVPAALPRINPIAWLVRLARAVLPIPAGCICGGAVVAEAGPPDDRPVELPVLDQEAA